VGILRDFDELILISMDGVLLCQDWHNYNVATH